MAITKVTFSVAVVLAAVAGLVIGLLARRCSYNSCYGLTSLITDEDDTISDKLLAEIQPQEIRKHLKSLTRGPHPAGKPGELEVALYIRDTWTSQGLADVTMVPYDVLLSYPRENQSSRVTLYDSSRGVVYASQLTEKVLSPEQDQWGILPPYNAFSGAGNVSGDLVYVNYGRIEDFNFLKKEKSINFAGTICIARYGKIFRGHKADNAERFGAVGLIMYSDPKDYARGGHGPTYPDTWWLPGTGVQRGSLALQGDTLTPGYPGTASAYFVPENERPPSKMVVVPIGYDDAKVFLQHMRGDEAPVEWRGDLDITYRLGPGLRDAESKVELFSSVHTERKLTYDIFAFIKGAIEPDRYVLLGNHYDAWVFGAVDPSSGTATMLEVSRAFSKLAKEGWRPRRTIVFCAWGAEEQGLIGSREWVENFGHILSNRAVAYLNVDIAVQGNASFRGQSLPLLFRPLYDAAKKVQNPSAEEVAAGRATVYDTWVNKVEKTRAGEPKIALLGSGSDYMHFVGQVGVTSADLRYNFDASLNLSSYPLYHSAYETFHLVDAIMDPTYAFHRATGQLWAELARRLADSYVLPFDVQAYAGALFTCTHELITPHGSLMKAHGLSSGLDYLLRAVNKFNSSVELFQKRIATVEKENPVAVRMLNDQMMQLERAFIDSNGLPGRPGVRHVVFAPSTHNSYAGSSFPALTDSLYDISNAANQKQRWQNVGKQLSIVTFFIETAAASLNTPTTFIDR